jgi:Raf kinase inhibitor-like YbhB/YbcL family protein
MRAFIVIIIIFIAAIVSWKYLNTNKPMVEQVPPVENTNNENNQTTMFTLSSPSFSEGQVIPQKFTCDGPNKNQDINPELRISNIPEGAKSLALILHDPDAPMAGGFTHWVLYNMPTTTAMIAEGDNIPPGADSGLNSAGNDGYVGPCPPSGTHHYNFTLYAMPGQINFIKEPTGKEVETAIKSSALASTTLTGLYSKK